MDENLADAVLGSLARGFAGADGVLDSTVSALCSLRWVIKFPHVVKTYRGAILRHAFGMLAGETAGEIDVYRWRSLLRLIRVFACALPVARCAPGVSAVSSLHSEILWGPRAVGAGAPDGRRSAKDLGIRARDVSLLLRALERVGHLLKQARRRCEC